MTLSVAISIVASYAAFELAERVRDARGRAWLAWLAGAATADGLGTWSMHYTGKLALRLPEPLLFDWRLVLLSLLVGISGSAAALLVLGRGRVGWIRAVIAGIFLGGVGISGLHYTAMAGILQPRVHHYHSSFYVMLSIALAIGLACTSLPVIFGDRRGRAVKTISAAIRGSANPAMHYTAMAAVAFAIDAGPRPPMPHAVSIHALGITGISIVPVMVLIVAVLTTLVDRLQKQRALLNELFEQAPEAVALMTDDDRIVRVNREFTRLFGYAPGEALGRPLSDLIGESSGDLRHRKDGTQLHVAMLRVPVNMPGGEVEIYAILRDVTEQKRAEEALRTFPRRLLEVQEAEGQRIARELHDEVGQILTGVGMLLSVDAAQPAESRARMAEARSILQDLIARVRNLALDLRPAVLDDFGLVPALEWLLDRYTRQTGIEVDFRHDNVNGRRFSEAVEIAAYRIVQEALTNVARHAQVRNAAVALAADEHTLTVQVTDRGAGFDPQRPDEVRDAVGLAGMRERASTLEGRLTVSTSPGGGTCIRADLPLRKNGL